MSEIPPDARPPPAPPPGAGKTGWTAGRVVAVVLGSIAALIAIALLLCAHIGAALFHHFVRKDRVLMRMISG